MAQKYKTVIAGWFKDPLSGEFQNDVYLECDLDELRKCVELIKVGQLVAFDSQSINDTVIQLRKDLHALVQQVRGIKLRSRFQPCHVGLFEVPADWSREDVELTIRYLDKDKLKEAERLFRQVFGHI